MERIHTKQNRRPITSGKTQRHLALPLIQPEAHYGRDSDEAGTSANPAQRCRHSARTSRRRLGKMTLLQGGVTMEGTHTPDLVIPGWLIVTHSLR